MTFHLGRLDEVAIQLTVTVVPTQAGLVQNLDLIITVDTATAHLAGAMGKPVWVLLPLLPDWRWMLDRDDSPWYPTMRLFRQERIGQWQGVIERVIGELRALGKNPDS